MTIESSSTHRSRLNRTLCLAPMLDRTDRHFRYFLRLISRHIVLFTEMVTAHALLRGRQDSLLEFHPAEHPLVFQIGGSELKLLADCATIVEQAGYDEINLNVGCPSDRVQQGRFGACLMREPELVGDCVVAMQNRVAIPVTVKTRLGVDDQDNYEDVAGFIETVSAAGCRVFYMHARKAWLKGLSPKQNRNVPPLDYGMVRQLAVNFPDNEMIINGGIASIDEIRQHLTEVDGVMIGRRVYDNPFFIHQADQLLFGDSKTQPDRQQVLEHYMDYMCRQLERGVTVHSMLRHILGLYHGQPGARQWRRQLIENSRGQCGLDKSANLLKSLKTIGRGPSLGFFGK